MKITQFLQACFTNPFGNLLAIVNLSMLFLGEFDILSSGAYEKLVFDLNRPAIIVSRLLGGEFLAGLFILQLVYLQWIFIGGFAKFVASKKTIKLP